MTDRGAERRTIGVVTVVFALLVGAPAIAAPTAGGAGGAGGESPGNSGAETVIVTLAEHAGEPGAEARELARRHGLSVGHVYRHAVRGFSARIPAQGIAGLERSPQVASVELDELQQLAVTEAPTGVQRIGATLTPTFSTGSPVEVDLDVAIIDTSIQRDHPDLNVNVADAQNFSTADRSAWDDTNGHGTHVAGTVAALDDGVGVVGVAPGARVTPVKVCRPEGCYSADIVAGIDWVAGQKRAFAASSGDEGIDFAVANFSISSADSDAACTSPANATHRAICGLVDAGVVFTMAAGNDGREKTPYPAAFSVSAIADFDGLPGGLAAPTCRTDVDDVLAAFSNYGPKVDIAAPGVCIRSTWIGGGYRTISGTSMAAPHVAGAVALYLHANAIPPATTAAGVAGIERAIVDAALPAGTSAGNPCSYDGQRVRVRGNRWTTLSGGPLLFVNAESLGGTGACTASSDDAGEDDGTGDGGTDPGPGDDGVFDRSVSVSSIAYATSGGKNSDRHLTVTVTLTDQAQEAVANATVAVELLLNGAVYGSDSRTTGADGRVSYSFSNAPSGTYTLDVTSITGEGLVWDEPTPSNGFDKS